LINSTVSGNSASGQNGQGGGIVNAGTLSLTNSTVSGNSASTDGGGILFQGLIDNDNNQRSSAHADLTFCTIYGNRAPVGADIAVEDARLSLGKLTPLKQFSQVKISNSIVAGDPAHPGPDIVGMLTSYGYNLFRDNSGAAFDPATSKLHGFDKTLSVNDLPKLFADPVELRNNGGPTETHKLGPDSPAIDQVPLKYCQVKEIFNEQSRMYTDQRGMKRPDGNEQFCDIGAYEYVDPLT
jgi:predicted outer membrane repeat protein